MAERGSTPTATSFELISGLKKLFINILFPDFAAAQENRKADENGSIWRSSAVETVLNGTSVYRLIHTCFSVEYSLFVVDPHLHRQYETIDGEDTQRQQPFRLTLRLPFLFRHRL